jgi:hypothetical protein
MENGKISDKWNKDLSLKRVDGSEMKQDEYKSKIKERNDDGNR